MSEVVKFYAWIEKQPSSLTVRIDGGNMGNAEGKAVIVKALKEVRFNKGLLVTDDEQVITTLRQMIKGGETITEDHELYLSKITTAEEQAKRTGKKNDELREENQKLRDKLAAQSRKDPKSRLGKNDTAKEEEVAASA